MSPPSQFGSRKYLFKPNRGSRDIQEFPRGRGAQEEKTMEILGAGVNNVKLLETENTWGWGIKLDKKKLCKGYDIFWNEP